MKIQEIRRNGSKYYHIYLPKNIVENVLHWHGRDKLSYLVVNDTLVLKKDTQPSNEWENRISCKICYNPTVLIKVIKNSMRRQYLLVSRCPFDHAISKIALPANDFTHWKEFLLPQVFTCDICTGRLIEEKRKFVKSSIGFRVHLKLFCRDCGRHRVKVIAQEIWDELHLQDTEPPTTPSDSPTAIKRKFPLHCPTCEQPIEPDQSFCGQCGTCIVK